MTVLDILSPTVSAQLSGALGSVLKLAGGGFLIVLFTLWAVIAIVVRSLYVAVKTSDIMAGINSLLRLTAYGIGAVIALLFMLVVTVLCSVSFVKVFLISVAIVFVTAFVARETFIFLIMKRFGKYIFYLTTLHKAGKAAYNYGKSENTEDITYGEVNKLK